MSHCLTTHASVTNLHVVTSSISSIHLQLPLNSEKFNLCTIIRIVVIVRLSRRIKILVVSASYRCLSKNSLKVRLFIPPCLFRILV